MSTDKTFEKVQIYFNFNKEVTGSTKLADSVLYSNLDPTGSTNMAVEMAKIYSWAKDVFTFPSTGTQKITINPSALPADSDTTYSFREGTTPGAFQFQENDDEWKPVAIHGVPTLDANGKILETYLPSYVDDVIEGYYYDGKFYTTSAHTTEIPAETGKIYVDITTSTSYRWGGSSYISITNPIDVFTGATSSTAGVAGIVPAPAAGDEVKFLRGDATWQTINIPSQDAYVLSGAYGSGNKTWVSTLTKNGSIAAGTSTVPTASTSVYGITSLSSATNSSAEDVAATPKAVKAAYDLANGKSTVAVSNLKSSGTKIATITVNGTGNDVYVESMTASTGSAAGTRGTVQPPKNSMDKYLRGDNTWVNPIDDIGILTLHCTNGTT
jgi:hypothetical protein